MSNQQDRATTGAGKGVRDQPLGSLPVEMGRRLVEHEHRRIREKRPRDDESLPLTAGELQSLFSDERVEAGRKRLDPVVEPGTAQGIEELAVGRVGPGEPQVLADRRVEYVGFLAGERERAAEVLLPEIACVAPADRDPTGLRVEKAEQKIGDGRLPHSARAQERHALSGIDSQVEVDENGVTA